MRPFHRPIRNLFAALSALLMVLPLTACARDESLLQVEVLDVDNGGRLDPIPWRGRDYLAGEPGHRFSVSLRNLTGERVLAVLSVDGVNAISGQTASTSQAGYVLEPWQQVEVRGWRKSYADIAEFYFTDLPDSYAARTGRPDNVGVIGVAAFRERRLVPQYPPYAEYSQEPSTSANAQAKAARERSQGGLAGDAAAPMAAPQQLGTGHGQRRYDPVAQTQFERDSSRPNQRISFYYDSWEALAARGIIRARRWPQAPDPFPIGFVPDPG